MEDLIQKLKDYDELYYNSGTSPVSDAEYDALKDLAKAMYPEDDYFKAVGSPVFAVPGAKVKFPFIVGSLNKYKPDSIQEFSAKFPAETTFLITPKLDGASVVAWFVSGKLVRAATRGDGYEGVDITHKLRHLKFDVEGTCALRGEVLLAGLDHVTLGMKNRRNGVVGLLGRSDNTDNHFIKVLFYETIEGDFDWRKSAFAVKSIIAKNSVCTSENLVRVYDKFKEVMADYDLDGIVIQPMDWKREDVEFPTFKCAFKVNDAPTAAVVDYIEWSVTRTSRIVPVIHFKEAILLSGAMVSKATGFNYEFIETNRIGPGAIVGVVRSGEVIPHIVNVLEPSSEPVMKLEKCPSCGMLTTRKGVDIICNNKFCGESQTIKLEYFLTTLGAEEVKVATLKALGINSFEQLYEITEHEIAKKEGFGDSSAANIRGQIDKTLNPTVEQFVAGFGIPNFGLKSAKKVFERIRAHCAVMSDTRPRDEENYLMMFCATRGYADWNNDMFRTVEGIGEKIIDNINEHRKDLWELYVKLKKYGLTFKEPKVKVSGSGKLAGKRVALTGNGPIPRPQLEEMIEAAGGTNGGITKDTAYLACEDPSSNSGKMKKAKDYGVSVISYKELIDILEG